jgi:hypothetical protein
MLAVGPSASGAALRLSFSIPRAPTALDFDFGFGCDVLRRTGAGLVAALGLLLGLGFLRRIGLLRSNLVKFVAPRPHGLLRRPTSFLPLPILNPALLEERDFERLALALLD